MATRNSRGLISVTEEVEIKIDLADYHEDVEDWLRENYDLNDFVEMQDWNAGDVVAELKACSLHFEWDDIKELLSDDDDTAHITGDDVMAKCEREADFLYEIAERVSGVMVRRSIAHREHIAMLKAQAEKLADGYGELSLRIKQYEAERDALNNRIAVLEAGADRGLVGAVNVDTDLDDDTKPLDATDETVEIIDPESPEYQARIAARVAAVTPNTLEGFLGYRPDEFGGSEGPF